MNLDKYSKLSGIVVSVEDAPAVEAQIRRTRHMLEAMLGFPLNSSQANTNIYNELGKLKSEVAYFNVDMSMFYLDTENLVPADEVVNSYRMYPYNLDDKYLHTDPFTNVHKIKLVHVKSGDDPNGVTIRTLSEFEMRVQVGRNGISKFIEHIYPWFYNFYGYRNLHHVQLAVDADWINQDCIPEDLLYVWADMVTFYSDIRNNVQMEITEGHRYTKFERVLPETVPQNLAIIKKYAGPYGSVSVIPV